MPDLPIHKRTTYDNHTLGVWRQCPRKGFLRHTMGLVPSGSGKVPALEFGIWAHRALDAMYGEKSLEAAIVVALGYTDVHEAFPFEETRRTPERLIDMLTGYWEHWKSKIEPLEVIAIEKFFDVEIADGYRYCGLVDKIFLDTTTDTIVGMDHKTTSMLNEAYISALRISQQFRGYFWWLKTHSDWKKDVGNYFYADFLLTAKTSKYGMGGLPYYRETLLADDEALEEWRVGTIKQIKRIEATIEDSSETELPEQNTDSCHSFNSLCPYYDVCSAPQDLRVTYLDNMFEQDLWEPETRV